MSQRRKIIIVVLLLILSTLLIGVAIARNSHRSANLATEPEAGGPKTVAVFGTQPLSDILLSSQFTAAKAALISYIQTKVGPSVTSANVKSVSVANDGLINFTVQTKNPNLQFNARIDRNTYFDRLIFSVPASDYKQTIPVYDSTGD